MKALLVADAPLALIASCAEAGIDVITVKTAADGRAQLGAGGDFIVVDARIAAAPRPLEEEVGDRLTLFFERLQGHAAAGLYRAVMQQVERPLISAALERARGIRADAARALGIDRGTLARRMKALGLR